MSTKIINCCQLSIFFSIFVNMKRFYSILFIISILHLTASAQEEYQYQFAGKCGLELKESLHKESLHQGCFLDLCNDAVGLCSDGC